MTLIKLRSQIDAIDDRIIALLKDRAEIVRQVGELKKESNTSQSYIRAGREASMVRNLIKKTTGILPPAAVATMWRMVISASLSLEQKISIYAYAGGDKSCFWLAREYFGTFLSMVAEENIEAIIAKVASDAAAVGVLPLLDNSGAPWWVRPQGEANGIYVFARIPFIFEDSALVPPALAIANTAPEPTAEDISLLAVTTNSGGDKLPELFKKHGLVANIISRSGANNFLLEVNRFVAIGDKIIENISVELADGGQVRLLGSYAVPMKI